MTENHAELRIQWLCCRARAMRWDEEVTLLLEEMRRYQMFMLWSANHWRGLASQRQVQDSKLANGLRAYALRQAALRNSYFLQSAYLWRACEAWITEGKVSKERRWFELEIGPRNSPHLISKGTSTTGKESLEMVKAELELVRSEKLGITVYRKLVISNDVDQSQMDVAT